MLYRISAFWARCEIALAAALAATITGLILLNVVTRSAHMAIYWIDEAAITAMVWMTFLAGSAAVHRRSGVAVTLLFDMLSPSVARWWRLGLDLVAGGFAAAMVWFCLLWFDPLALYAAGFDTQAFQGETFNFIYAEPTVTLGIPKAWVWSVMIVFTFGLTLHALSNLVATVCMLAGGNDPQAGADAGTRV
ncbi:TRAP transporter small permease [Stappia stellulata]|uniref:TRAP transporter small permease n=1 Tax=Stappia stellulata TaxID=71235 RepID=UPI00041400C3|nr:TRAP transporter small permease subunit [Stappia stellulata]